MSKLRSFRVATCVLLPFAAMLVACSSDESTPTNTDEVPSHKRVVDAEKLVVIAAQKFDVAIKTLNTTADATPTTPTPDAGAPPGSVPGSSPSSDFGTQSGVSGSAAGFSSGLPPMDTTAGSISASVSAGEAVDPAALAALSAQIQTLKDEIAATKAQLEALQTQIALLQTQRDAALAALAELTTAVANLEAESDTWFEKTAPKEVGRSTVIGSIDVGGNRTRAPTLNLSMLPGAATIVAACKTDKGAPTNVTISAGDSGTAKGSGTATLNAPLARPRLVHWKIISDVPAKCLVSIDAPTAIVTTTIPDATIDKAYDGAVPALQPAGHGFLRAGARRVRAEGEEPRTGRVCRSVPWVARATHRQRLLGARLLDRYRSARSQTWKDGGTDGEGRPSPCRQRRHQRRNGRVEEAR